MKSKCKVCDKKLDNKFKRVMKYMWTPWKEPRFICQDCQKTRKKNNMANWKKQRLL
ncbi:hypothetical protein [endosymbiont GvMRE of Glomus versiforme]|uniref:hypothetical protein n=1 Tax=endosymbiont GvMRE of Glomus versiforme TaxID=2039283 RepID=UPI000ED0B189|nr:hypothetical protein [endosymbiont GvMRE of Glomus versiforme]RHZ37522.1 hypothetical protein GvMRE_I1g624 [endosymbiont GvMRE of Glomus versiforme]